MVLGTFFGLMSRYTNRLVLAQGLCQKFSFLPNLLEVAFDIPLPNLLIAHRNLLVNGSAIVFHILDVPFKLVSDLCHLTMIIRLGALLDGLTLFGKLLNLPIVFVAQLLL